MYKIKDYNQEVLEGTFYQKELQKVKKNDTFLTEAIVGERKQRGKNKFS